jgi:hypothetical protein
VSGQSVSCIYCSSKEKYLTRDAGTRGTVTLQRLLEDSVGRGLTVLDELMWEWTGIAPRREGVEITHSRGLPGGR